MIKLITTKDIVVQKSFHVKNQYGLKHMLTTFMIPSVMGETFLYGVMMNSNYASKNKL
jgi:ABC-type metal ion transport system substrate-binding protein